MDSQNIEFYVNNFSLKNFNQNIDLNFISPIARRRLNQYDKCTLSVLNDICTENTENIIFSSKAGESEKLMKIIGQYTEYDDVSPNAFSGSVHNYPIGFFLCNKKKSIPYNCLSAGDKSISAGLLVAVCSSYHNVIYCYTDCINDNNEIYSFGINFNHTQGFAKYKMTLYNSEQKDNFEDYISIFQNEISEIVTPFFILERV